ncbi:AAA family ATPase [Streptomyces sp. NPDC004647]|uniref:McrB family protein n=1 Tax=Streptomyces sp. NPDC004647 TaxID=3154671 RepID=UPI00339EF7CF
MTEPTAYEVMTKRRKGEIIRGLLSVFAEHPDGIQEAEADKILRERVPPHPWELISPADDGRDSYSLAESWFAVGPAKYGWVTKKNGAWVITEEGRRILATFPDPEAYMAEADRLWREWHASRTDGGERAWLVRGANVQGKDLVPTWLSEGFCSLAASRLGEVGEGATKDELKSLVHERYQHLSYNAQSLKIDELHAFLSRMQPADLVATTTGGQLYVGTITGAPEYVPTEDGRSNLRRDVDWHSVSIDYADLPEALQAKLSVQHDVVDLTQLLDVVEGLFTVEAAAVEQAVVEVRAAREVVLKDPDTALADELLVPLEWLQEMRDLLQERKQLIFYGPPGTGKTYLAQAIAEHLAGGRESVKLVQFHPSYAYEDFFEGIRPVLHGGEGGTIGFDLRSGPFRKLVDAAEENPETPYFLIIDEINRANLAKVFGELYFVLEYRNRSVDLQYSGDFSMPSNVFLIGTMNTADRSIALVDAAMRRRFAFEALHPDQEPTRWLLSRWIDRHHPGRQDVAQLWYALNFRIDDKDFKIGPSYLMRDSAYTEGGLERIWRTAILPLLEEHHYGQDLDIEQRYGLASLRHSVVPQPETTQPSPEEPQ